MIVFDNIPLQNQDLVVAKIIELAKHPQVITLQGDLGAGKTSLAAKLIKTLMQKDVEVTSPTFNLVHTYDAHFGQIWHMDLYRLKSADELFNLGFDEALNYNTMIIEWPEIAQHLLPKDSININISFSGEDCRNYSIAKQL